jgi:membrane-bound serine protease (ClpP class)
VIRRQLFAKTLRLIIWCALLCGGIWNAVYGQAPRGEGPAPIYIVDIKSTINPGALGLLVHAIRAAETDGAAALIVRINTPGGLLSTTRDMVGAIAESKVPIIGYVAPDGASAGSAGAFILLSTHIAAMNTGTNIGAASPIADDGRDIGGTLGKKIMNDSRAFMRGIAAGHGRNAEVAERFVSEAHSLSAVEAKEQNVIDIVVDDLSGLLAAVNGRQIQFHGQPRVLNFGGSAIHEIEPRTADRLLSHIAHPQIAHLLISLGALGIYIEILSPGLFFPGVFGAIAVILGLVAMQTLPVNMGFLLLLLFGLVLMIAEYFVAGFGVLGIGGAIAFILGSFFLFEASAAGEAQHAIVSISVAISAAMVLASYLVTRGILAPSDGRKRRPMQGKTGEAMVNFDQHGHVLVDEQCWPAETLESLRHGDRIVVVAEDKSGRLTVKKQ